MHYFYVTQLNVLQRTQVVVAVDFSKRERIRYVCYMLSQIRLSSVCLSVCDAGAPYLAG